DVVHYGVMARLVGADDSVRWQLVAPSFDEKYLFNSPDDLCAPNAIPIERRLTTISNEQMDFGFIDITEENFPDGIYELQTRLCLKDNTALSGESIRITVDIVPDAFAEIDFSRITNGFTINDTHPIYGKVRGDRVTGYVFLLESQETDNVYGIVPLITDAITDVSTICEQATPLPESDNLLGIVNAKEYPVGNYVARVVPCEGNIELSLGDSRPSVEIRLTSELPERFVEFSTKDDSEIEGNPVNIYGRLRSPQFDFYILFFVDADEADNEQAEWTIIQPEVENSRRIITAAICTELDVSQDSLARTQNTDNDIASFLLGNVDS
ncbi:MAG TPA: hypothetical protein PLZ51_20790, partial [Aggregatilineales bacterium]|nr:hypothetical protein [Aggregatilineales bacterium]